jgi:hypothetical protein
VRRSPVSPAASITTTITTTTERCSPGPCALLNEKASQIADLARGIEGSEDVWFTQNEGVQYLKVEFDR